ncbi:hypothetical protein GOV14_06140 [Candidatus Pacearchaeota archaeon]|nr:hypothetical protein [Candidatus Pacearchaeota archaeon]
MERIFTFDEGDYLVETLGLYDNDDSDIDVGNEEGDDGSFSELIIPIFPDSEYVCYKKEGFVI